MKEKILSYVNDNRLFVSIIGVLLMVFCFFLWMTCGAGNSMEAETSYTDVTTLSTSSSKQNSKSLTEVSSQSQTEGSEKVKSKVTVDVKAVSYTHLDVYKRQKQRNGLDQVQQNLYDNFDKKHDKDAPPTLNHVDNGAVCNLILDKIGCLLYTSHGK